MPSATAKPDLYMLMNAYAELEVAYSATAADIRRAFRQLAAHHHPDKFPADSPDQRHATERMIHLNAAYDLIREAPLRHHRISRGAGSDGAWTDAELDEAIRRGHAARRAQEVLSSAVSGALGVFFALFLVSHLRYQAIPGLESYGVAVIILCGVLGAWMGRRFVGVLFALHRILSIVRLIVLC